MSALGQKQTLQHVRAMSALPPKADTVQRRCDVRFVPKADISRHQFGLEIEGASTFLDHSSNSGSHIKSALMIRRTSAQSADLATRAVR